MKIVDDLPDQIGFGPTQNGLRSGIDEVRPSLGIDAIDALAGRLQYRIVQAFQRFEPAARLAQGSPPFVIRSSLQFSGRTVPVIWDSRKFGAVLSEPSC